MWLWLRSFGSILLLFVFLYLPACSSPPETCSNNPCPFGLSCEDHRVNGEIRAVCIRSAPSKGDIKDAGSTDSISQKGCLCGREGIPCTINGHRDCDQKAGFFCLSTQANDPEARCIRQCNPNDAAGCKDGYVCTKTFANKHFCVKTQYSQGGIGKDCAKGGKAECKTNMYCYERWNGDPNAFCTKPCSPYNNQCGAGFTCASLDSDKPYICIKRGSKSLGQDCSKKQHFDCRSGVCAKEQESSKTAFCSKNCNPRPDTCPIGYNCRYFSHSFRYLCSKSGSGTLGSICNKNGSKDCKSGVCVKPSASAINKICSQSCSTNKACPVGYHCTNKVCLPKTGSRKIGESCSASKDCSFGLCINNTEGQKFCTQKCVESKQCPKNYVCRTLYFGTLYCLPKITTKKKTGEPCPNGTADCKSGACLSDPIKSSSFCSQICSLKKPCPKPFVCTKITKTTSFCTPKGYQLP